MKGLFIPGITVEMFRSGCLESIEALMAEGEIYDIEYEPERKTGKWIREYSGVVCSECDYNLYDILSNIHTDKGAAYVFTPVFYNFCPNCGAYMRGEQDDI